MLKFDPNHLSNVCLVLIMAFYCMLEIQWKYSTKHGLGLHGLLVSNFELRVNGNIHINSNNDII